MDTGTATPQHTRQSITGDPERDHELLMLARTVQRIVEENQPDYERFKSLREGDDA